MQLTERDVNLLTWINGFGFVTVPQIARRWQTGVPFVYRRLKKLRDADFVIHERLLYGEHGHYRVSTKGVKHCDHSLPALRKVRLATYKHDLAVVDLAQDLQDQHQSEFITERMVRQQLGQGNRGRTGHLPDGILAHNDDHHIAIELELSNKGRARRNKILSHYVRDLSYKEVWYFCGSDDVRSSVQAYCSKYSFLKVFPRYAH